MTIPASFPRRISRGTSVTAPSLDGAPAGTSADPTDLVQAPGSWPWRRAVAPAPLAVVVLMVGIIGQVTHTGLFFVPALAAMIVAAVRLRRERD